MHQHCQWNWEYRKCMTVKWSCPMDSGQGQQQLVNDLHPVVLLVLCYRFPIRTTTTTRGDLIKVLRNNLKLCAIVFWPCEWAARRRRNKLEIPPPSHLFYYSCSLVKVLNNLQANLPKNSRGAHVQWKLLLHEQLQSRRLVKPLRSCYGASSAAAPSPPTSFDSLYLQVDVDVVQGGH